MISETKSFIPKPKWIKTNLLKNKDFKYTSDIIKKFGLVTVCQEARCPNIFKCFRKKQATFMILGRKCTRHCKFCNVNIYKNRFDPVDVKQANNIALAIKKLNLKYVVITSVTRDDLPDLGLDLFIKTIEEIKNINHKIKIELLIPDFKAEPDKIEQISKCNVAVIGHNLEMVSGLYKDYRPDSSYNNSLKVLRLIKKFSPNAITKTALMIGLGENQEELNKTFSDIVKNKVDILYIGQYLQPSLKHVEVKKYYSIKDFEDIKNNAIKYGIKAVKAGPMIRSSFQAEEVYWKLIKDNLKHKVEKCMKYL